MSLISKEKEKIVEKYKLHKKDTGSSEVQVALLSKEIEQLLLHLKKHPKDIHSKEGLLKMVSKRKNLLRYLKKENIRRYNKLVKALDLRS
jgi:small subunit ribosomal protein S15